MERDVTREGTADDLRQALRASEARFRNTIEKNADGILIVGRDGAIRFANPAAEVLLGRRGGQLVGHVFGIPVIPGETTEIDLLHGGAPAGVAEMRVVEIDWEGRPAYLASRRDERARTLLGRFSLDGRSTATLARVLTGGRPEVYPELPEGALAGLAPNPEAARTLRDFGCRSAVLLPLQARGRTLGVVTLLRGPSRGDYGFADLELAEDLVRRAALAIDNARLYEEAQEAVRRRDEFLAMLAHELRNPLAPVRNAMELMRLKCPDDGELRWARTMVERQVTHMTRLV